MTTETKTMTIQKFVENFKCLTSDDFYSGYETKEEEAKDLICKQGAEMESEFKKFAETFCQKRNIMNKGTYEFISCDGNTFTYTITK